LILAAKKHADLHGAFADVAVLEEVAQGVLAHERADIVEALGRGARRGGLLEEFG